MAYDIIKLDLADKSGQVVDSIKATPEHPFFTPNGLVEMGKLQPGMEVITRENDGLLIVKAVKRESHLEGILVYNFEVEDDHTYFVGQANGGIFVHNMCAMPRAESPIWNALRNFRNGIKSSGYGKDLRYYEWDFTHGDIEVYNSSGRHVGSMHPESGLMYKPAIPGRKLNL
jgi:hypothetical protein